MRSDHDVLMIGIEVIAPSLGFEESQFNSHTDEGQTLIYNYREHPLAEVALHRPSAPHSIAMSATESVAQRAASVVGNRYSLCRQTQPPSRLADHRI